MRTRGRSLRAMVRLFASLISPGSLALALLGALAIAAFWGHQVGAPVSIFGLVLPWTVALGMLRALEGGRVGLLAGVLPLERRTTVTAMFVVVVATSFLLQVALTVGSWFGDWWFVDAARPSEMLFAVLPGLCAICLLVPLGLAIGVKALLVPAFAVCATAGIASYLLSKAFTDSTVMGAGAQPWSIPAAGVTAIFVAACWWASVRIYEAKDL